MRSFNFDLMAKKKYTINFSSYITFNLENWDKIYTLFRKFIFFVKIPNLLITDHTHYITIMLEELSVI